MSYHISEASQCESRNIITSPVAALAPARRALINPLLSLVLTILTTPSGQVLATYSFNLSPNSAEKLKVL